MSKNISDINEEQKYHNQYEEKKILITRKLSKIFANNTFFKDIHNINNENIQIIFDNTSICENIYDILFQGFDGEEFSGEEHIIIKFKFISENIFNDMLPIIGEYTDENTENIIDAFINYEFNTETFRTFLINTFLSEYYKERYAYFEFLNSVTGCVVSYSLYISKDDKPIKIIVSNGYYLL
jgi:hypothetical protein